MWLPLVLIACALSTAAATAAVDEDDVEVAGGLLRFRRNQLQFGARNASDLVDTAKEFLFTHDAELALPAFVADDAVLRISPRALQAAGGALVQLDVAERRSSAGSPRLFKKLRKFIGERLMWGLLGLVLVVKLLSLKFMFLLPVIMGVAAAKKLLLKVILFVFPFLGHLFKLCPYYAPTKYHHHHHQIAHLHRLPPHVHDLHAGGHPQHHQHHHHHHQHDDAAADFGYYSDGPGFISSDIRRDHDAVEGEQKIRVGPLSPADIENMVLKAEKEAMLKARLQEEQKRVEIENKRLQDKIKTSLKLQEKLKIQSMVAKQTSEFAAAYHPPPPQAQLQPPPTPQLVPFVLPTFAAAQPSVLTTLQAQMGTQNRFHPATATTAGSSPDAATSGAVDPFYSPILQKIDAIFHELVIADESCRERLVCNMYSNPELYSPHSNLISAELSRDANELQKPTTSNVAVIRFYKYVQAARDGQDKRDCATLYPTCSLRI